MWAVLETVGDVPRTLVSFEGGSLRTLDLSTAGLPTNAVIGDVLAGSSILIVYTDKGFLRIPRDQRPLP